MNHPTRFGVPLADGVRFERLLPGPIERVWSYLVESEKRGQWLASGAMPPQVGGAFTLHFRHADLSDEAVQVPDRYKALENGHDSQHRVLAWEPPNRLAFTWSDGIGGESEVTIELAAVGADVRLVLTQQRLTDVEVRRSVGKGWHTHLAILADRLNGRAPRAFWPQMAEIAGHYDRAIT